MSVEKKMKIAPARVKVSIEHRNGEKSLVVAAICDHEGTELFRFGQEIGLGESFDFPLAGVLVHYTIETADARFMR